jgi:hypothetical protein
MNNSNKVKHLGIYRGVVIDNNDPGISVKTNANDVKIQPFGRCKIFFEGIYPDEFREKPELLPWAEPVYPIFGGNAATEPHRLQEEKSKSDIIKNYSNELVGWSSTPHIGAYVWGFFEDGNIQYPKFFGTTQTGKLHLAEHKNQHVIATDNVKIIIDEEQEHIDSTNRCNSNNTQCTATVEAMQGAANLKKKSMPTRVNITVIALEPENSKVKEQKDETGKDDPTQYCAINLNIIGNVNSYIKGNVYEEHDGDKFITRRGNTYERIEGDIEIEHIGYIKETHTKPEKYNNDSSKKDLPAREFYIFGGDNIEKFKFNNTTVVGEENKLEVSKSDTTITGENIIRQAKGNINATGTTINLN